MKETLKNLENLHEVWSVAKPKKFSANNRIKFDELTNSIMNSGPFYYYIIDFFDMSISNVSDSIYDIHDFEDRKATFDDVLKAMHPDDVDFVVRAEAFLTKFFSDTINREKLLTYKISYCFRSKLKNGKFGLFNHQALMLTMDENGGYGKSLNIHTHIDHLSDRNTYKISLIGLNGEPSFMNISLDDDGQNKIEFSRREIDIIKLISDGASTDLISDKLSISPLTVKKHRSNILDKAGCSNTAQLIKNCFQQGII
ncbi:helix-turn-helix transcriptional regulator [Epilithonimonas sp. JDS]|uniref:response regulator transcription factor n=1 Tax=Epilithonimonas sp. JDS TaxID=2902797 RepID=UPI001E4D9CDF|nr:helix-turn-helix transcriptional regulator [Epilithonimonas sp. JDS]MCD9854807.1 helix-turn-helix transcriptional regulator [Epilithonimonas sp. JDS]